MQQFPQALLVFTLFLFTITSMDSISDPDYACPRFLLLHLEKGVNLEAGRQYQCKGAIDAAIYLSQNHGPFPGSNGKVVICHFYGCPNSGPIILLVSLKLISMPITAHPDSAFIGTIETIIPTAESPRYFFAQYGWYNGGTIPVAPHEQQHGSITPATMPGDFISGCASEIPDGSTVTSPAEASDKGTEILNRETQEAFRLCGQATAEELEGIGQSVFSYLAIHGSLRNGANTDELTLTASS
ncbi:hypothetical protein C8R43DRAFT_944786 [Mycena crocata]|nr:hypothetical protein C8R43DRAFT_944786 [Mycena crocata]